MNECAWMIWSLVLEGRVTWVEVAQAAQETGEVGRRLYERAEYLHLQTLREEEPDLGTPPGLAPPQELGWNLMAELSRFVLRLDQLSRGMVLGWWRDHHPGWYDAIHETLWDEDRIFG
ncbi:MAG: hypothetical protein D6812_02930 [Deltaproteobacteria bacterium]|nr:MAG: hypothetical protein D6812_02930 [Deltaproteobacteria bacterium]